MANRFDRIISRAGTNSIKWDNYNLSTEIKDAIPMSVADMDFETPAPVIEAIVTRARHGIFGYTAIPESYYSALTGWLKRRFGWPVNKDWIRFSPGVIPALNFAIQAFTEPGDRVVIQPPVYHPFRYAISNNKRTILNNPLRLEGGRYVMDLEGLKRSIDGRTRMIILSSPHNPVGRVWERDELKALTEVCLENRLIILSDEIHSDFTMPGVKHTPIVSLSEDAVGITVTCTSPSKTFNLAELHVANIIIPDSDLFRRFDDVLIGAGINRPNVLGAVACEAAYGKCEGWVDELVAYIHDNYVYMKGFLNDNLPEVGIAPLEGTYLGWLDLRSFALSEVALEKLLITEGRVVLTPGSVFGAEGEGFFRINLAYPRPLLKEALKRIVRTLKEIKI
jgi:cysteine-S-conjugate beta-lyase